MITDLGDKFVKINSKLLELDNTGRIYWWCQNWKYRSQLSQNKYPSIYKCTFFLSDCTNL